MAVLLVVVIMTLLQDQVALAPLAGMGALQVLLPMEQQGLLLLAAAALARILEILALAVEVK